MTNEEATKKAKKNWGKTADLLFEFVDGKPDYRVGDWKRGEWVVRGKGTSWEEAFKRAKKVVYK